MTRRRKAAVRPSRPAGERVPDVSRVAEPAPIVDLTRVVEARRRIASGWYDRSDVRDSLVDAVLQEMRGR
jgi:hypothetical protein